MIIQFKIAGDSLNSTSCWISFQGVPFDGKFDNPDQLIMVFTSIIYTCSVAHASTNFPQYDEYAFPPNYPASMKGMPPKNKVCVINIITNRRNAQH